jgi:fructose-1,6-bisphosphatase III
MNNTNYFSETDIMENLKYLNLLSKRFPTIHDAATEIINLEAILNLPKGTEQFMSDVHGEDEAFGHIVKSGSGIIRKKIDDVFGNTITNIDKKKLAILIYYPSEVIDRRIKTKRLSPDEMWDWFEVTLHRLILILREVSSKYTRSKVRKALPVEFQYIIEELLHHRENDPDKEVYYHQIIKSILQINRATSFIVAISEVIQHLSVDHLHLIGDIFDRGPKPDKIVEQLMNYHSIDIQWGNHDILWMGAATGSRICITNVIRICARYGELDILEENFGINLLPIAKYAMDNFPEVEEHFYPKNRAELLEDEAKMIAQINKAASFMTFKLEDALILRNTEFQMDDRRILYTLNYDDKTVVIKGKTYPLNITELKTLNPKNPCELSTEELQIISKLQYSFTHNNKLQEQIAFLFEKGSIYKTYNGNLLYHGCIPINKEGNYTEVSISGKIYSGKSLLDKYERMLRKAYVNRNLDEDESLDIFWYLWSGKNSSLFGKDEMKTFERTFISDKSTHTEVKNSYYNYIEKEEVCNKILKDFDLNEHKSRIINGHVPVKVIKGESPVKANGRLIVIDGGLSKAYQEVTGIAGYTLIYNSHGMLLAAHEPFTSAKDAYENNVDMISSLTIVEATPRRVLVEDTDIGKKLQSDIDDLKLLLAAYQQGYIKTLLY